MKSIQKKQIKNPEQIAVLEQNRIKVVMLTAMCLAMFGVGLNETSINVALPTIQISLDASVSGLRWIANAYILPMACLVLPSGTLVDTYGYKHLFSLGLVIFTMACVICGLAPNLTVLLLGRTIQGIGAVVLIPSSLSILSDIFSEPKDKLKALGIFSAVSGLARFAGPALGGLLVDTLGWQSLFFLNLPLGIISFWITSRFVREAMRPIKQRIDVPGMVLSIVFLASLAFAFTESNAAMGQLPLATLVLAVAGLSLIAFLLVESRSSHPMLPLSLFRNPTVAVVSAVNILIYFSFASLVFIFSLFLQQVLGDSAAEAGMRFLPFNGAFVIGAFVSGWFAARLRWRFSCAIGLMLLCSAVFSFIHIEADIDFGDILWNFVLSGFGTGLALAPMTAAAMSCVPSTQRGIVSAIIQATTSLGCILGIALHGKILYQKLTSDLTRSLMTWGIPSNLQDRIIDDALHGGAKVPSDLPASISPSAFHQTFSNAFVSSIHTTVLIDSLVLLAGALLILVFAPPSFKTRGEIANDH